MDLSLFDYPFPKELVAQHPLPRRDDSRMMVVHRRKDSWEHRRFPDLLEYLRPGDLFVLNDAEADLVPFQERSRTSGSASVRRGGLGAIGGPDTNINDASSNLQGRTGPPIKMIPPLPPYIKRKKTTDFTEEDYRRYRTVYARTPGSKAAPTAGFHFTDEILEKIKSLGAEIRFLTLHVSYDTYKPIRCSDIREHPMHGEEYVVPDETAEAVTQAKKKGRRVIAVGTTVVRTLESWALAPEPGFPAGSCGTRTRSLQDLRKAQPQSFAANRRAQTGPRNLPETPTPALKTNLFIYPDFQFQIVDALLTNFHRPRSTVLVMVSAFAGRELILSAYEEAIRERYRLFSYGDCMLII